MRRLFADWTTPHGSALIAVLLVIAIALLSGCAEPKRLGSVTLTPEQAKTAILCWRNDWDVRVDMLDNGMGRVVCTGY